jgi:hypothetical protein
MCWGYDPHVQNDMSFFMGYFAMKGANYNDRACTLGVPCVLTLQGYGLMQKNRVLILKDGNCGDNAPGFAMFTGFMYNKEVNQAEPYTDYALGTPTLGIPGTYKICWAHDAIALNAGNLGYRVRAGALTIAGPVQTPQTCVMSTHCNLQLSGVLLNTSNHVMIVIGTACGAATPALGSFGGLSNPKQAESSDPKAYKLGIPSAGTPGNAYSICWAHSPASNADYKLRLGVFTIVGPNAYPTVTLANCILGLPCIVTITGFGLASTNKIIVTAMSDSCGSPVLNQVTMTGLTNPASIGSTLQNFNLGTPTSGVPGDYTICWGHNPASQSDYWVRKATLRMAGPAQAFTQCTLSENCRITLAGVRMSHLSKVLIISSASKCG